jgi:hypothetical protein
MNASKYICSVSRTEIIRLRVENQRLREALIPHLAIDERKLSSLAKRPYAIGIGAVRERLNKARAALAEGDK